MGARTRWLIGIALISSNAVGAEPPALGRAEFIDRRNPPAWLELTAPQREAYELGHAIFNTQWVVAGTRKAERRDGLGPLFNAATCDACHNEGARGQGLAGDGVAPAAMVMQLSEKGGSVYGQVLNTNAIDSYLPEASITVHYQYRPGSYPDGSRWSLRTPEYTLSDLRYGPLAPATVIKPRLAPALFGAGLLEAVPAEAIIELSRQTRDGVHGQVAWRSVDGKQQIGRFGWQADAVSIEDQTARAFSREMGLSSRLIGHDDCSAQQTDCLQAEHGGAPEVSDDFLDALTAFQRWIAVPQAPVDTAPRQQEAALFSASGCDACHRPQLPVQTAAGAGTISAYTDLLLRDLGVGLADHDVAGRPVASSWRTAPLWGLGHAVRSDRPLALLHDGRARSVEEAILWHDGEAAAARRRFERLSIADRKRLLDWVAAR